MTKRLQLTKPLCFDGEVITHLLIGEYYNGRRTIEAYTEADEFYTRLTVNLVDHDLPDPTWFFATAYSYNLPLHVAALAAGIIEIVPGLTGTAGYYGEVPVCRLTAELEQQLTSTAPDA